MEWANPDRLKILRIFKDDLDDYIDIDEGFATHEFVEEDPDTGAEPEHPRRIQVGIDHSFIFNRCFRVRLDPSIEVQASVRRTRNLACSVAQFCFSAARTGPERHPIVENFMLINDLATVATEVPVYFFDKRIGTVTGHIDILQVRNGKV